MVQEVNIDVYISGLTIEKLDDVGEVHFVIQNDISERQEEQKTYLLSKTRTQRKTTTWNSWRLKAPEKHFLPNLING